MNIEQLLASFRVDADDATLPYLFQDEWVIGWLAEAQSEAALRGRLILEDSSPAICQIPVVAGTSSYDLHRSVCEIAHLRFVPTGMTDSTPVALVTREWLDDKRKGWRDSAADTPAFAIQSDTRLRLAATPDSDGVLHLEAYRMPLKILANEADKPEIHEAHHRHLVHWALHRAFSRPDSESIDPQRAERALAAFANYFGLRPDSDMRRSTRHDLPQTNALW